jgi:hypothetical protein
MTATVDLCLFGVSAMMLWSSVWINHRKSRPREEHEHCFMLVATTYAEPNRNKIETGDSNVFERLAMGATTFIWRCMDPTCPVVVTQQVIGKIVSAPPNNPPRGE